MHCLPHSTLPSSKMTLEQGVAFPSKVDDMYFTCRRFIQEHFSEGVSCCTVGELTAPTVPFKFKNKFILAVASLNSVSLFTLNGHALKITPTATTFTIGHCLQV